MAEKGVDKLHGEAQRKVNLFCVCFTVDFSFLPRSTFQPTDFNFT